MSANGTAVTLWQHAYVYNASQGLASPLWGPIYGGGLAADFITWGGATPDWSLPATRTAVTSYMSSQFLTAGIEAFKLDECDGGPDQPWFFPDSAQFPSGFNGAAMHNIFGLLYAETYHEMFAAAGKRTFLKARAGYMGGQRYPTTMYSDSYDYDAYINALVNTGFGGFTWAPELRSADSDSEFVRRAQVCQCIVPVLFSSSLVFLFTNRCQEIAADFLLTGFTTRDYAASATTACCSPPRR